MDMNKQKYQLRFRRHFKFPYLQKVKQTISIHILLKRQLKSYTFKAKRSEFVQKGNPPS